MLPVHDTDCAVTVTVTVTVTVLRLRCDCAVTVLCAVTVADCSKWPLTKVLDIGGAKVTHLRLVCDYFWAPRISQLDTAACACQKKGFDTCRGDHLP